MFITFENGKTWPVEENFLEAIVDVPLSDIIDNDFEGFLDILADEAVGNELLMDISYEIIGAADQDTVRLKVKGDVSDIIDNADPEDVVTHANQHSFYNTLAEQLGWSDAVLAHAITTGMPSYGPECVIQIANGRELRCPASPESCNYVRIVEAGHELMYWAESEWRDDPEEVMGAILGLANGTAQPAVTVA